MANLKVAMRVHMVRRNLMRGVYRRREAKRLAQQAFGKGLTPQQLCKVFEEIDVDHGGTLTRNKMKIALEKLGHSEEETLAMTGAMETDELNFEQFCKLMGVALPLSADLAELKVGDFVLHPLQGTGAVTGMDGARENPCTVKFNSGETHEYSVQSILQQRNVCMDECRR